MRTDAQRNRSAVLEAAGTVFAERGLDVSLNEIARRAGVGNATLYRHFPTREALVAEVFARQMQNYLTAAEGAAVADDPLVAFRGFVTATCELQAASRALADLLVSLQPVSPEVDEMRDRHYEVISRVIRRAVDSGVVRADLRPSDIAVLLMANAGLIRRTADDAPGASARLVAVWLAGATRPDWAAGPPAPAEEDIAQALLRG
ncbi:TetR/AcrR family transcriptional regulator [Mycolicibacterium goodii]|uniref:TetR/AcrR family transcriptional regulator n=1 Tax=Mycolicibacterium goodii TaxID=134601 RepID=UPI001BDCEF07|nr:TetR/AcrR family transcriptional regulator [Mycolicibacterium goodii]MBU8811334.1 TetR/AcrR family transcriptional regulator [Mycolicibacterium goodii]